MGMFDSVYTPCPRCGHKTEFQSKEGECSCNVYTLDNAPTEVLIDIVNDPQFCGGCKKWFVLFDPAYPPTEPPRPYPKAVPVREPNEGEFTAYQHNPDSLRWWDAPFTIDDLRPDET